MLRDAVDSEPELTDDTTGLTPLCVAAGSPLSTPTKKKRFRAKRQTASRGIQKRQAHKKRKSSPPPPPPGSFRDEKSANRARTRQTEPQDDSSSTGESGTGTPAWMSPSLAAALPTNWEAMLPTTMGKDSESDEEAGEEKPDESKPNITNPPLPACAQEPQPQHTNQSVNAIAQPALPVQQETVSEQPNQTIPMEQPTTVQPPPPPTYATPLARTLAKDAETQTQPPQEGKPEGADTQPNTYIAMLRDAVDSEPELTDDTTGLAPLCAAAGSPLSTPTKKKRGAKVSPTSKKAKRPSQKGVDEEVDCPYILMLRNVVLQDSHLVKDIRGLFPLCSAANHPLPPEAWKVATAVSGGGYKRPAALQTEHQDTLEDKVRSAIFPFGKSTSGFFSQASSIATPGIMEDIAAVMMSSPPASASVREPSPPPQEENSITLTDSQDIDALYTEATTALAGLMSATLQVEALQTSAMRDNSTLGDDPYDGDTHASSGYPSARTYVTPSSSTAFVSETHWKTELQRRKEAKAEAARNNNIVKLQSFCRAWLSGVVLQHQREHYFERHMKQWEWMKVQKRRRQSEERMRKWQKENEEKQMQKDLMMRRVSRDSLTRNDEIQRVVKKIAIDKGLRHKDAIMVQRFARWKVTQFKLIVQGKQNLLDGYAITIQRRWRGWRIRSKLNPREETQRREAAAIEIQSALRAFNSKKIVTQQQKRLRMQQYKETQLQKNNPLLFMVYQQQDELKKLDKAHEEHIQSQLKLTQQKLRQ